ncbi:TrmH family RNA methyltransferase [Candidatus Fermentibacteria bacterium]|nr:TrmH family RNA methyltransferase [Candidatus Fermentibacteria bacterium]
MTITAEKGEGRMPLLYPPYFHGSSGMPLFVLDNFRSAFNVGSVFRTAESVTPAGVILCGICCRPGNRKLAHTARGTQSSVPWRYFQSLEKALRWVSGTGRKIVVVERKAGAVPVFDADLDLSSAFVLGNEALGVAPEAADWVHQAVYFPQSGRRDCINVSSMAAVVGAEIQRRRLAS